MECLLPCEEQKDSCPAGSVCFFGFCSQVCNPQDEGACGLGKECAQFRDTYSREQHWFCRIKRGR
jgi:hypothetical protein